jgi:hypothetical protein
MVVLPGALGGDSGEQVDDRLGLEIALEKVLDGGFHLNSCCFRKVGTPVTITTASVSSYQPGTPPGLPRPAAGTPGLTMTVPAADVAALTAASGHSGTFAA